jgi:hypothetical protein
MIIVSRTPMNSMLHNCVGGVATRVEGKVYRESKRTKFWGFQDNQLAASIDII